MGKNTGLGIRKYDLFTKCLLSREHMPLLLYPEIRTTGLKLVIYTVLFCFFSSTTKETNFIVASVCMHMCVHVFVYTSLYFLWQVKGCSTTI